MEQLTHPPHHAIKQPVPIGWMRQFRYMARLYELIRNVPGDVVECGVGQGTTLTMLAYLVGSERKGRCLRGFDSFEGFPEPSEHDASWRDPKKGEWAIEAGVTATLLEGSGIHAEYPDIAIQLTKGFFTETLPLESAYQIAFLHADCDLYTSYQAVLENMWPRVASGGVVLFDEYREYSSSKPDEDKWPGATRAIDEFFCPLGLTLCHNKEAGKYYLIKP